ncbi:MAG: hypothetical protein NTAFB05_09920 [Nitrobacter sp.]
MCTLEDFGLIGCILIVCALAMYSVRVRLLLMNEERENICPRCGLTMALDKSANAARPIHRCLHCEAEIDPNQTPSSGWINSTLKPPE